MMTDTTKSLLMVGPTGLGPFRSPEWRVGFTVQLVEGSGNGPYWLYTDRLGREKMLMIDSLHTEILVSSVVLLVTVLLESTQGISILEETHKISRGDDGEINIAPFWDLAEEVEQRLTALIAPVARLGFVRLDENSLVNDDVIAHLLRFGVRAEAFVSLAFTP